MTNRDDATAVLEASTAPPEAATSYEGPSSWWRAHRERTRGLARPIDRAIVGATEVDRVAWAFAGGYRAALSRLVPTLPDDTLASLAATEARGGHPRAIETTLADDGTLSGHKRWVTLGPDGGVVLVVARRPLPDASGRPRLVVVRVPSDAAGLRITATSAPFVPELPHGEITLERVAIRPEDVLPGDGYADYLKPFRTIEDLHVQGAICGLVLGLAHRAQAPRAPRERLLGAIAAIRELAACDPRAGSVHLALGGVLSVVEEAVQAIEPSFAALDPATRDAWARDRAIFGVAGKARAARLEAAWSRSGAAGEA